ncbi:hypothetical protein F5Y16DRAFT_403192 [Xylariaceae sp. FL0255]|nr:hypothetical protein F5Y16DRAFT_403192 [Xylariaceae sp. FL0255]
MGQVPTLSVNTDIIWISADGPETIRSVRCISFSVDKCLEDSFDSPISDSTFRNPDLTTSNLFSRLSTQHPHCGDCLTKLILASTSRGLQPLLPTRRKDREIMIKTPGKYQRMFISTDHMKFAMIKDAEQAEEEILENAEEISRIQNIM